MFGNMQKLKILKIHNPEFRFCHGTSFCLLLPLLLQRCLIIFILCVKFLPPFMDGWTEMHL
jgi:hypothetical protein